MLPLQALLLCLLVASAHAAADVPASSSKLIFILAGQSNMAGRGGVTGAHWDGVIPSPDCSPSPSVLRLSPSLRWEQAREPLHQGIDGNRTCGVGPGMAFANAVLRGSSSSSNVVVGLVPCAAGGTRIAEWAKGSELYLEMLRRAQAAVGAGGRIAAVLWYQGESDTVRWADASGYGRRMGSLVRDLRTDLAMPDLLVIQVGLASGPGQYTDVVREAQRGLALPDVRFVDAMGLPLQDDRVHLTTQAQVQLGHMLAQSYLDYAAPSLPQSGHAHPRTPAPWWLQIMLASCFIFLRSEPCRITDAHSYISNRGGEEEEEVDRHPGCPAHNR